MDKQEGGPLGAVVEEMDSCLAVIWKKLADKRLLDNTIFMFSSDNGPWIEFPARMSGDSVTKRWHAGTAGVFRGSKGQSYEGGIREPFIVYWKNHTPSGLVLTNPVSNVDILPTLARWANAPLPEGRTLDGQDISDRNVQRSESQWARAKSFDTYSPLGPFIYTDLDASNLPVRWRE